MGLADSNPRKRPDEDDERELLGLWLSRLMFNQFVGWPPETRSFEEFVADTEAL
jgi:hypothetical protein